MKIIGFILMVMMLAKTAHSQLSTDVIASIEWPTEQLNQRRGYTDGKHRAEYNVQHGKYLYLAVRRESWNDEDYFLNKKYGISPSFATPTNETDYLLGWIQGYNEKVATLFAEKFGTNVFQEAKRAIQQNTELKAQQGSEGTSSRGRADAPHR